VTNKWLFWDPFFTKLNAGVGILAGVLAIVSFFIFPGVPPEYKIIVSIIFVTYFIAFLLYVTYHWIKFKGIKNPRDLIDEDLTDHDIEFAIYCLVNKIKRSNFLIEIQPGRHGLYDSNRNLIIGIDRGGAIVGGLLGKCLGLSITTIGIRYSINSPLGIYGINTPVDAQLNLANVNFKEVRRIILVDDAIRTGYTMNAAKDMLINFRNNHNLAFELVTASILFVVDPHPQHRIPDFYIYKTTNAALYFPWDVDITDIKNKLYISLCE